MIAMWGYVALLFIALAGFLVSCMERQRAGVLVFLSMLFSLCLCGVLFLDFVGVI